MPIAKSRLRHIAAGLLGNFVSRNNNVERLWALGVLYSEAQARDNRVELDLLAGRSDPEAPACASVARTYAAFLCTALRKHGFLPEALSSARITIAFGLPPVLTRPDRDVFGDPFDCTVTLVSREGVNLSRQASRHCAPHRSPTFVRTMAMRDAGWRLLQAITLRSRDCDGRWSLEVLRDANRDKYEVELALLHQTAAPDEPANVLVARLYAGVLRDLLGEWMPQLGAALVRVRFLASTASPLGSAYVETRLVAPEGHTVWFNTCMLLRPAPPWDS